MVENFGCANLIGALILLFSKQLLTEFELDKTKGFCQLQLLDLSMPCFNRSTGDDKFEKKNITQKEEGKPTKKIN